MKKKKKTQESESIEESKEMTSDDRMASNRRREFIGSFDWISCRLPSCPYNTTGVRVSSWWLFLFLCYVSCFAVGIPFTVVGFASMGNEVAALGIVLAIIGVCLAFVCDLLRRCGCGWTKITLESAYPRQTFQESPDVVLAIPFLPGYPGFSTPPAGEGTVSDNPPPYAISQGFENSALTLSCTCTGTSLNLAGSALVSENPGGRDAGHTITLYATNTGEFSRTVSVSGVGLDSGAPTSYGSGTRNPPPPPYDFEMTHSQDRIPWLNDIPPPYGDFV